MVNRIDRNPQGENLVHHQHPPRSPTPPPGRRAAHRRHARPLRRAGAALRPGERVLRRGLRGAARQRLPPASLPGRVRRRRAEPRRDQPPATAHRLRRTGDRRRRQHAPLLRRLVRRPAPCRRPDRGLGARSGRPRATSSPPVTARPATTCPVLLSIVHAPSGSRAAGRSPVTRSSAACRRCGRTSACTRMDTSDPANPQIVHAFVHRDSAELPHRGDLGHARDARDDVARHDPRAHVRPRRGDDRWSARPASPAPGCSTSALFAWALLGFGAVYASIARARVRRHRGQAATSARRSR